MTSAVSGLDRGESAQWALFARCSRPVSIKPRVIAINMRNRCVDPPSKFLYSTGVAA